MSRVFLSAVLLLGLLAASRVPLAQVTPTLQGPATPAIVARETSPGTFPPVRFAVIGDNGTGDQAQFDVGRQLASNHAQFPFDFVLMVGDNLYSAPSPREFSDAFERPYKPLLDDGVRFYAVLGNHDSPDNRMYDGFNMDGQRYYSYARSTVRFIALDTNILDAKQITWFEETLKAAREPWKVVYFHHPLYSNGTRHGSNVELRVRLEPLLVRYGVNVVFSGHDHIYERFKPQKGITYFVAGASGKLRKGIKESDQTAVGFDTDQSFMLVEIAGDELAFRAISRTGRVIDSGVIHRQPTT